MPIALRALPFFAARLVLACAVGAGAPLPAQDPAPAASPTHNELRAAAFAAERDGRFAAAADAFLALSRAEPDRPDWVVAAGRCLGRSGRFAEAIDILDAARKRFPGFVELPAMLARTLLLQTEREPGMVAPEVLWADAAELAEEVLRIEPDQLDSRLLLAQARYLLGERDEAVRQAEEATRRHPDHPGGSILLGRIAGDRFAALLARYRELRPTGQEQADLVAAIDRERKQAHAAYERAIALDANRAFPHAALGKLAWLDGRRDDARRHLFDALAIDPDTAVDHALLTADLRWEERRDLYRQLRSRYEAGTASRPEAAATLWFHEGRADLDGRDFAAARSCFERALAQNPAAQNAHYYAFLAAWYLDDQDGAEQHAAAYAAVGAPAFADVLRELAAEERAQVAAIVQYLADRAYQQTRIPASRDLNHVIACYKDSADAWNNHAFLCRETGRFDDAFTSYRYAIDKEPNSPQLWNDAAVVLQYHLPTPENLAKAREMYTTALRLADAVLADAASSAEARQAAATARENARQNLDALPK